MQVKKSPKADLNRNISLYFVIGLCLVLFITWRFIEWKTYEKSSFDYEALQLEDADDEEIPITKQIKTPPPPSAPEVIEIVENEGEVEETIIESTETDQEEVIEEVEVVEEELAEEVPFAIIEEVTTFPG